MRPAMEGSVLDSLGGELIGVISPVSICMLIVVLLISSLSSPSASSSATVASAATTAATLVYSEYPSDSPGRKFAGALLNAAAFVALVAVVTFALVVLYYYRCTAFLKGYMRLSTFLVLASMGGPIVLSLLRRLAIPLDAISALILLFNTAAVGAHAVLSPATPVLLRQAYLVALAVCVAAWFARLPEWTTWALLLALAAYDLAAVLCPRGPLRILVELAASRDDDLPALVYEARPAVASISHAVAGSSVELQPVADPRPNYNPNCSYPHNSSSNSNPEQTVLQILNLAAVETSPLMSNDASSDSGSGSGSGSNIRHSDGGAGWTEGERNQFEGGFSNSLSDNSDSESEMDRGIRLGLGDFVFYSVLVGRAAMYDLMTVYACYLAIISGLACTLVLLSVFRHALPALPISIALGTGFYFLTRLLMEPFVVGASSSLDACDSRLDLIFVDYSSSLPLQKILHPFCFCMVKITWYRKQSYQSSEETTGCTKG